MKATDQNGLTFTVYQCGVDHVRDAYGHVYRLTARTGSRETWADANGTDVIETERCPCEGKSDPAPGAALFNDDHVERCDDCERFATDDEAAIAYVAGLNRAAQVQHFAVVYARVSGAASPLPCVALASDKRRCGGAPRILYRDEIKAELVRLNATITTEPYNADGAQ